MDLVLKRTPWHGWYAPPCAAAVGGGAIGDVPRLLARPSQCTRHLRRETEQQVPLCMRLAESRRPGRPGHEQQQHRPGSDSAHGRPLRALVSLNWYRIFHCLSLSFTDSSKFKGPCVQTRPLFRLCEVAHSPPPARRDRHQRALDRGGAARRHGLCEIRDPAPFLVPCPFPHVQHRFHTVSVIR